MGTRAWAWPYPGFLWWGPATDLYQPRALCLLPRAACGESGNAYAVFPSRKNIQTFCILFTLLGDRPRNEQIRYTNWPLGLAEPADGPGPPGGRARQHLPHHVGQEDRGQGDLQ